MILSPVWLVVMVALRMPTPNSMSLMFPMMFPLAFCGPPVNKKGCKGTFCGLNSYANICPEKYLGRAARYTWIVEKHLLDRVDRRY